MKMKFLVGLLILLVGLPLMAAPPKGKSVQTAAQLVDNTSFIAANRIYMFVTNHGNFGRDLGGVFGNDYGTYFPYTSVAAIEEGRTRSPFYAGGLWVGAVDSASGDTLVIISEYSSEYVPGPSLAGDFQTDRPEFKVYKLFRDSLESNPNADYTNWPWETQGAPLNIDTVFDTTVDPPDIVSIDTTPGRIGDHMTWTVFNDYDEDHHDNNSGSTAPLGLDVKQTIFAFERTAGALANIVFLRWQVYNTGDKVLDSCYFSIWSDPDLGGAGDDLVGCDTLLNLAYIYNSTNNDAQYAAAIPPIVPALGLDFFQGPLIETGLDSDTAKMWGRDWVGFKNMGLFSFNKYINGTDPNSYAESYQYMKGLDASNAGIPFIHPFTGDTTRFVMTGNPVSPNPNLDWIDDAPDDRRMMLTTGPVTFRPGDSTEILGAMVIGQGGNNLSSITVMKGIDAYAQKLYELDFVPPEPPARPVVTAHVMPGEVTISWTDTSEVTPGDYEFQGYTLWQGESSSGPWTEIKTWDIDDEYVGGMIDTIFVADAGQPLPVSMRGVTNSGLNYSYTFTRDMITGSRLYDVTEYYYKVSAFAWGLTFKGSPVTAGDHFLESETAVTAIPQAPKAGYTPQAVAHSDVTVSHSEGVSDGVVTVEVLDPMALTGHDYSVTFGVYPDTAIGWSQDTTFHYTYNTLTDTCGFELDSVTWVPVFCVDTVFDSVSIGPLVYDTTITDVSYWDLNDLTLDTVLLSRQTNQTGDDEYFVADGFLCKVAGPEAGIRTIAVVANGAGPLDPPESGAAGFQGFPVPTEVDPDGYPTDGQQVGDGLWLFHTGDNGGTSCGGTRGSFDAFMTRTFRDQARLDRLGAYDWEVRFTGSNDNPGVGGGWALNALDNSDQGYWVPFELWRTGSGTPDDPSDDLRLIPWIWDDVLGDGSADNFVFDLSQYGSCLDFVVDSLGDTLPLYHGAYEHSVSGGNNDPYTDWIYWRIPLDETPGHAQYDAFAAAVQTDPASWPGDELPVFDRQVFVSWNGFVEYDSTAGYAPVFTQDMPEEGTVFRVTTFKPNSPLDEFTFSTPAAAFARSEDALDAIKAVPNPFYLFGPYDPAVGNYQIKFHHLPAECSISIYNLAGDFITRIDKNDDTPFATWNLQTENRIPVASGIYIYVVDAPGFGQKIGKMAVFYEQEVLTIY